MSRFLDPSLSLLAPYVPGEQPRDEALIKLNTNENPYEPGPAVQKALAGASNLRRYPDPEARELVRAVAAFENVDPAQVAVGNGSDELLAFAFMAFCPEEKTVCFPELTYGFYPVFAGLMGARYREIPLRGDFTIDPEDYAGMGGMVVLANPNAPTGIALGLSQIRQLLDSNPDDLVLVDEAYVDFGGESAVPLLAEYDNLLVVKTLSKSRSLAGARIGYAVGSPEVIADLNRIKFSFNPYNLDRLAIALGTAAMEDDAYFRETCAKVVATRERFRKALEARGFKVLPSSTNFVLASLPGTTGGRLAEALRERGILVRYLSPPSIRDYVRITIGTDGEMEAFLKAADSLPDPDAANPR